MTLDRSRGDVRPGATNPRPTRAPRARRVGGTLTVRPGVRRSRGGLACLPILLALALSACRFTPDQLGPIYSRGPGPTANSHETHLFWPFFRVRESPEVKSFAIRPFWEHHRFPDGSERSEFLWPFGASERTAAKDKIRLFPLFWWERDRDAGLTIASLTPLLVVSKREGAPTNWIAFPLGGHWRDLLGWEEIRFAAFPLYVRSRTRGAEGRSTETTTFLWPVFRSRTGETEGFAVFPLFGADRGPGERRTRFVLWPLYTAIDDPVRGESGFLWFPFYGKSESPTGSATTVFWPFYSHGQGAFGESTDYWPVYKSVDSPSKDRFRVFPLYATTRAEGIESETGFWPFLWKRTSRQGDAVDRSVYVLPFLWSIERTRPGEPTVRVTRIFPFLHVETIDHRIATVASAAPLPYRPTEAVEIPYDFLWTVVRAFERPTPSGDGRENIVEGPARLFRVESGPAGTFLQLPLVRIRLRGPAAEPRAPDGARDEVR